jgi:hypothetical protein
VQLSVAGRLIRTNLYQLSCSINQPQTNNLYSNLKNLINMSAIQLNFALRTSANCKSVHLLGSWDNYTGQLPLSKDSAKSGSFKGSFRFQSSLLKQGERYWYYYILDGYHVSHDPAREHTVEPTTGRKLNILDVPAAAPSVRTSRHSRNSSSGIAKGRPVSPTRIVSPQPYKPGQTKHIIASANLDQLSARFNQVQLEDDSDEDDSDAESDVPSLTSSRSSASSRASSVSSTSSCCTCERFGITRSGNRVRLDCGGSRCADSDEESDDCASESENESYRVRQTRRQGMVVTSH